MDTGSIQNVPLTLLNSYSFAGSGRLQNMSLPGIRL